MNADNMPHGIYPMLYAFFNAQGGLDQQAVRRQVQAFVDNGAHGMAVLGLGSEGTKLSDNERRQLVDWVAEELGGRLPLAVTVNAPDVDSQIEFAKFAQSRGASWVILQPPPDRGVPEDFFVRFFGAVADRVELPVAIQNAPEYLGVGLTPAGIRALAQNHPNFRILKGEGAALVIRQVIEETGGRVTVFNGRGGLELIDNLRAGCAGMIPASDSFDHQARLYDLMRPGAEAQAEALYPDLLPAIVFVLQSLAPPPPYGTLAPPAPPALRPVAHHPAPLAPPNTGMAGGGNHGRGYGKYGKGAQDMTSLVPPGTLI